MSKGPKIHFPTEEENKAALDQFFTRLNAVHGEQRDAIAEARPALDRLMKALQHNHNTGQPYKIREILFSLWNGKPGSLVEIVCLDWELKRDLCAVLLAFGCCPGKGEEFFYKAIEEAFSSIGLFDWFREERFNVEKMRDYVKASERETTS
jgi:hypothetical protein